jgi:hypothetical protein
VAGHTNISTTSRYLRWTTLHLQEPLERFERFTQQRREARSVQPVKAPASAAIN